MRKSVFLLIIAISFILPACSPAPSQPQSAIETPIEAAPIEPLAVVDYDEIESEYEIGYYSAVDDVFRVRGELYFDGVQYASGDFSPLYDNIESDSPDDAFDEGYEDALNEIFSDTNVLCWGSERYYRNDY